MRTIVVINDLQIPYHDKPVLDGLVIPFIEWLKPEVLDMNGDIVDCPGLSDFSKDPMTDTRLTNEIQQTQEYMDRFNKMKFLKVKRWRGGNHEDRLRRTLWKHAGNVPLNHVKVFKELFETEKYHFDYTPYGSMDKYGSLDITHGYIVRQNSAFSAKAHFDRRGCSVMIGHTHRLGIYYRTNQNGVHAAYENGCLCRLDPDWCQDPDWQQGLSVVKVGQKGVFSVQQIPILNRKMLIYGEKIWEI